MNLAIFSLREDYELPFFQGIEVIVRRLRTSGEITILIVRRLLTSGEITNWLLEERQEKIRAL